MIAIIFAGISALYMLNKSISLANPVIVSFIRVTDIVVSYIIQVIVLRDAPNLLAIIGSCFVIIAVSLLSLEHHCIHLAPPRFKHIL